MKRALALIFSFTLLLLFTKPAKASLIEINKSGEVVWKVLADEDSRSFEVPQSSSMEIKEVGEENVDEKSKVELTKDNGKISLLVNSGNTLKTLDVADWKDSIIEVEERPETQKISISLEGENFAIKQKDIKALTSFPIKIDPTSARVSLTTSSGDVFLAVMPYQAVESVYKSKLISNVNEGKIEITENEHELEYVVKGQKQINFANLYFYSFPIEMRISALTGEVVGIDSPSWFKYLGFLFT